MFEPGTMGTCGRGNDYVISFDTVIRHLNVAVRLQGHSFALFYNGWTQATHSADFSCSVLYQHDYSAKHNTSHLWTGINLQVREVPSTQNVNSTELMALVSSSGVLRKLTEHDVRARTGSYPPHMGRTLLSWTILRNDAVVSCYDSQRRSRMTWLRSTSVMIRAGKSGGGNLSQSHSAHQKSYIDWPGIGPGNSVERRQFWNITTVKFQTLVAKWELCYL